MNPKAAQAWQKALQDFKCAQKLIHQDQDEKAKTVFMAAGAIMYIYGPGPHGTAAHKAAQSFIANMANSNPTSRQPGIQISQPTAK